MANGDIKITELPVGILVQGSLFITSEPEQGGGYVSTKISATDIATLVASIVSYASLNTTSKTVIGAINEILSKAEGKFIVVQTLPVSDIDPYAIYLVPKQTPGQSDSYDEYIYTNNAWEKIGTTDIDLSNYYTKTQVDSLLSAKADTSSLATVATTGNYNDLTNKPTIPQIADNVIGNDSTYSSQKIISLMPTGEASGAVASFNTEIAAPLVDVTLEINARQAAGTPTPQSPLPITGFTGANVADTSNSTETANYIKGVYEGVNGFIDLGSLTWTKASNNGRFFARFSAGDNVKPAQSTVYKGNAVIGGYTIEPQNTVATLEPDMTFSIDGNDPPYIQIVNKAYTDATDFSNYISGKYIIFELATPEAPTITPVQFQTLCTSFGISGALISLDWTTEAGTVYGVEIGLLSGLMTVKKAGKIYTGSIDENWFTEYDYNFYGDVVTGAKTGRTIQCSIATSTGTTYTGNLNTWISNSGRINITIPTITHTVEDFRQLLTDLNNNNTPMAIVYELAQPVEIQLDPEQMSAFIGANNIWHDANGNTTVKFKQDIENYVADQIASQLANN